MAVQYECKSTLGRIVLFVAISKNSVNTISVPQISNFSTVSTSTEFNYGNTMFANALMFNDQ